MLAVASKTSLSLIDPSALKRNSISIVPSLELPALPTSSTWASDNGTLFISTATEINQHSPSGELLKTVYSNSNPAQILPISCLTSKEDGSSIYFTTDNVVYTLDTQSGKVSQTFNSHLTPIVSLSLSNDNTLLASASSKAVHVHNLSSGVRTALRGLPSQSGPVRTCVFHPHIRTRLLLGMGADLIIYDTTKPSAPLKVIPMDKQKGDPGIIIAIACSPFSKTFTAVACSEGFINFVDIEKQKALYSPLDLHVPPTSLLFSAEGVMLFAGTEDGKLLVIDLRSLDKTPKSITVSSAGDRVNTMCIQKKLKAVEAQAKPTASAAEKPLSQKDVNKDPVRRASRTAASDDKANNAASHKVKTVTLSPPPRATPELSPRSLASRKRIVSSSTSSPTAKGAQSAVSPMAKSPSARKPSGGIIKSAFSPSRTSASRKRTLAVAQGDEQQTREGADLDISVQIEDLLALPKPAKVPRKENLMPLDDAPLSSVSAALSRAPKRTRTTSSTTTRSTASKSGSSRLRPDEEKPLSSASEAPGSLLSRERTESTSSSSRSRSSTGKQTEGSRSPSKATSSPDLPAIDEGPTSPVPIGRKGKEKAGFAVLGLGTPEVDRWIRAGEGVDDTEAGKHARRVGFAEDDNDKDGADTPSAPSHGMLGVDRDHEGAVEVSPRRHAVPWAPIPSPLRDAASGAGSASAQDFLQSLLRDAMYEFRQETRSELRGLHLDLIRMGQGWKKEVRDAMGEWREEMTAVREENARLREENERLRRGY